MFFSEGAIDDLSHTAICEVRKKVFCAVSWKKKLPKKVNLYLPSEIKENLLMQCCSSINHSNC